VVKFVWLGYIEPGKFENMPKNERDGILGECFDYDDQLRANGHYAVGEALRPPISAKTVRLKTARSWQLMVRMRRPRSKSAKSSYLRPATWITPYGSSLSIQGWEIRPAGNLNGMVEESKRRRAKVA
jgi:hypothetical protein